MPGESSEGRTGDDAPTDRIAQPGEGGGWTKLKGDQGWRDADGNIWKKDQTHKDHWDITDPRTGKKIREVDFRGVQLWPAGPKNKNKRPK